MMKRSMIALLLVFALCMGLFSGCGKKEGDESSSTDEMARREIVELTMYIPGTASEDRQAQDAVEKCKQQILTQVEHFMYDMAREDINEVDVRIQVEQKLYPAGSPENEQVKRDILTGQGPDLYYFWGGLASPFQYESGLADLAPFFEESSRVKTEDLCSEVFEAGKINGVLKTAICSYAVPILNTSEETLALNGLEGLSSIEYGTLNSILDTPQIKERGSLFTVMESENGGFLNIDAMPYNLLDLLFVNQCVESFFDYNTGSVSFSDKFASIYQDYRDFASREDVRMTPEKKQEFLQEYDPEKNAMAEGDLLFQLQSNMSAWADDGVTPKGVVLRMPGEQGNFALPVDMVSISSMISREKQQRAFQFIESLLSPNHSGAYTGYSMFFQTANGAREKRMQNLQETFEQEGQKPENLWWGWYYDQAENISSCNIFDEYYYTQVFQPIMEDEGKPLEQRVRELENRTNLYLKE